MTFLIGLAMLAAQDTVPETINIPVKVFPKTDTVQLSRILYDSSGFVKVGKGYIIRNLKVTPTGEIVKIESYKLYGPKGQIKEEKIISVN